MIVVDAAAVPDFPSGARTRLRGLLGAYARLDGAPPLAVRIARGSSLLEGVELRAIRVEEVARPGGPLRRALRRRDAGAGGVALARAASLWHSETIPPLGPRGAPALLTLHDLRWSEPRAVTGAPWTKWAPRHAAARLWLPRLARSLAGVVTVSAASARRIASTLRVPAERVHVVPNADVLPAAPRLAAGEEAALLERLGVRGRTFFLAVGRLEPRKGLELALAALASARPDAALAQARIIAVGAGAGEPALRRAARELGVAERLVAAGPLDDRALASLYAHAAALVFPSRYEGFGFPVHEARAHGCPVVARALDVLVEAAIPGVTLLPGDVERWEAELERLAAAPRAAGPAGAPHEAVTWNDAARRLAALYRSLLTGSR